MKEALSHLIESLREELKEYGEMLALLDHEERVVTEWQSQDLLQYAARLHVQSETVAAARREREQRQHQLIRELGLRENTSFDGLLPHLPADYRPLLQALAQENQESLVRVRRLARQNHALLNRIVELMKCFLELGSFSVNPEGIPGHVGPTFECQPEAREEIHYAESVGHSAGRKSDTAEATADYRILS